MINLTETLLVFLLVLAAITVFLLWKRQIGGPLTAVDLLRTQLELLNQTIQQTDHHNGDEFSRLRQEFAGQNQALRLDVATSLKCLNDSLLRQVTALSTGIDQRID